MSTNVVNLDAHLPREDMGVQDANHVTEMNTIGLPHLNGNFFAPDMRKPHFQRETNQWTPSKVVDLLRAFVDRDLIPAVILWRSGPYLFVVDGAHRLSALLGWIRADYGDGQKSLEYFGGIITDEQRKAAQRTKALVEKEIGNYSDYEAATKSAGATLPVKMPPNFQQRLKNLNSSHLVAQWVPASDSQSAENSFFRINQAATPIDATEKRILKARRSASAVASRAITNGGTGHRYWSKFDPVTRVKIEETAKRIFRALFDPPITSTPVNTLDVPIAGRGYNALPFVFDLVNIVNNVAIKDTTNKANTTGKDSLPDDEDGLQTLDYLVKVEKAIRKITTDVPESLGLHPVVYFYSRSGQFKPEPFFAAMKFLEGLSGSDKLKQFQSVRAKFEDYLIEHSEAPTLIVHQKGTGSRSIPWIVAYYEKLFEKLLNNFSSQQVFESFKTEDDLAFLTVPPPGQKPKTIGKKADFSTGVKTAAYFAQALPGCTPCAICGARIHKNSMHIDHKQKIADGGHAGLVNAQVTHPWCDSTKG